jgi:hypothetical protein
VATQPSKPSPEVLAKLKQLREQFAAKAEMERRRRQAQDNWEQSDTYKRQYPQGEAEGGSIHPMGINVASDRKHGLDYADLIVDGHKTVESRNSDTLRPYVGKRVAIVRTGAGKAKAIGEVTIGEPIVVNKKKFRNMEPQHLVPEGSTFDIKTPTKHMYPLSEPVRYDEERDVGHGIIARKVVHKAEGGRVPSLDEMRLAITKAKGGSVEPKIMSAAKREANLAKFLKTSKVKERLFHGTKAHDDYADEAGQAFSQFTGKPTWLAKEPYTASGYSGGTGSTYPVHAQVKKPLTLNFDANDDANNAFPIAKKFGVDVDHMIRMRKPKSAWEVINDPAFVDAVEAAGYDALMINEGGYKTYGVFGPNKIKSAIGNRGTFDPKDPDITKKRGGRVTHAHHLDIEERPL